MKDATDIDDQFLTDVDMEILDELVSDTGRFNGFESYYPKVSRSPEIRKVYSLIKKVAKSNASVLIQGETGTGKELIAGAIVTQSNRADKPFIQVNCASLPEQLLESELFGHERGAFTSAYNTHIGKFEQADGGTLFLDEIGDMQLSTQAKILRVLQEQSFNRVGGQKTISVDVRIIAATNKDLWQEMEAGNFRADLYYRLNVVTLSIPPLRERKEDIPLLAEFYRRKFAAELKKNVGEFSEETMQVLCNHIWSGNIRELRNQVERAVLVSIEGKPITPLHLSMTGKEYFAAGGRNRRRRDVDTEESLNLQELERRAILKALDKTNWIQKEAADLLGISPRALNYKISQHSITHTGWRRHT